MVRYRRGVMFRRSASAVVLGLVIAAVPTVVSLCELRCVAAEVAAPSPAPPACHAPDKERQSSPGGHHDCAGHVLLAKGGASGIGLRLDLALVAVLPSRAFVPAVDPQPDRVILESADLSPPSARTSDILRL